MKRLVNSYDRWRCCHRIQEVLDWVPFHLKWLQPFDTLLCHILQWYSVLPLNDIYHHH